MKILNDTNEFHSLQKLIKNFFFFAYTPIFTDLGGWVAGVIVFWWGSSKKDPSAPPSWVDQEIFIIVLIFSVIVS